MLEVYTLNMALMAMILYKVVCFEQTGDAQQLYQATFAWGLSLLNHILMGLFLPAFIALLFFGKHKRTVAKPRVFGLLLFFFFCSFQLYCYLFLKEFSQQASAYYPLDFDKALDIFLQMAHNTTGGNFKVAMFPDHLSGEQLLQWRLNYIFLLFLNYPSIAFFIGLLGAVHFFKKCEYTGFIAFFAVGLTTQVLWSANYIIWDMYAFGMPVWVLFGLLVTFGFQWLNSQIHWRKPIFLILSLSLFLPPAIYKNIVTEAQVQGSFWHTYFQPFTYVSNVWNPAEYFANPNKRDYDRVHRIADELFRTLPPGAYLYDDDAKGHYPLALYYQKVVGKRKDLNIRPVFNPLFTEEQAKRDALEIKELLARGHRVFLSSPYWPERDILNHLFVMLSPSHQANLQYSASLPIEHFEAAFPVYMLKRLNLASDPKIFYYELALRDGTTTDLTNPIHMKIEGEDLRILEHTGYGTIVAQALDTNWSRSAHLMWISNKPGDVLHLGFEIPRRITGSVYAKFTQSYDFGNALIAFKGNKETTALDLYAPSPKLTQEILLFRGDLAEGLHEVRVEITGQAELAQKKYGFGIDYLRIQEK
jgi:hypothetical protein